MKQLKLINNSDWWLMTITLEKDIWDKFNWFEKLRIKFIVWFWPKSKLVILEDKKEEISKFKGVKNGIYRKTN